MEFLFNRKGHKEGTKYTKLNPHNSSLCDLCANLRDLCGYWISYFKRYVSMLNYSDAPISRFTFKFLFLQFCFTNLKRNNSNGYSFKIRAR
jgi:hypothetical protein